MQIRRLTIIVQIHNYILLFLMSLIYPLQDYQLFGASCDGDVAMVTTSLTAGVNPNININEVQNLERLWHCPCLYDLVNLILRILTTIILFKIICIVINSNQRSEQNIKILSLL